MLPTRAAISPNDQILVAPGGPPLPGTGSGVNLPPPDPTANAMRNRNWAAREAELHYQMQQAPLPHQFTRDGGQSAYLNAGGGNPLSQYMPQEPATGFAANRQPTVYSAPGVSPGMIRPTYAYNRVVGDLRRRPTMYATGTWPGQYYPGGSNTFIPSWEATGLIVKFTREPSRFRINWYVKDIKVPKDQGYYLTLNGDDPYRVVSVNDYLWEDSADAPGGRQERQAFGFMPYRTARYCFPFSLGQRSVEQAEWPILAEHAAMQAAKAMTVRTILNTALATTSANWTGQWGTNFGNSLGAWTTSSETDLFIQRTLNAALIAVEQASGGIVTDEDALQLTINPTLARGISVSPEYRNYIKGSPDALSALTDQRNPNRKYGLAPYLYGLRLVVENAIQVTTPKPGNVPTQPSTSRSYIWPTAQAVISSKPEGISGVEGEQSLDFSTFAFRFSEQMTTEQKSDSDNRRNIGRVVENYTVTLQAPQCGYLINSIS